MWKHGRRKTTRQKGAEIEGRLIRAIGRLHFLQRGSLACIAAIC